MRKDSYSVSTAMNLIVDNSEVEASMNYKDSNGNDFCVLANGDDLFEVTEALISEFAEEMLNNTCNCEEEHDIDFYIQENEQLRDEIEYLRDLVDELSAEVDCYEQALLDSENCKCKNKDNQYVADIYTFSDMADMFNALSTLL